MMGSVLSSTMINVAIPDVMGAYGIGQDQAHWMSTAMLAAMPVMMLTNGWFVNNFGARNTYVGACVVFCIASLIGQFIPNYYGLVAVRTVQGACAGLLQPLTMTVIFPLFDERQRGRAMGIYGMGFILGPSLGPVLGGFIVDHLHWQDIFGWSIPLMLLATIMGLRYLPARAPDAPRTRLNWLSLVLVAVAIATFLSAISNARRDGWNSPLIFWLFFTAATCFLLFLVVELVTRAPLLEMRLFSERTFTIAVVVGSIFGAGMFGSLYILPIFAQQVLNYSAFEAGLLLITGLMMVPAFPIGGRLAESPRCGLPIALGMVMFGVSSLMLAGADIQSAFWFVALWATFGRIGLSIAMPSLQTGALRHLSADLLPYGAGTMNFVRMTGAALGTNIVAITVENRLVHHADHLASTQTANNSTTADLVTKIIVLLQEQGVGILEEIPLATRYLERVIIEQANTLAYQDGFTLLAIGFFLAAISALALAGNLERAKKSPPKKMETSLQG